MERGASGGPSVLQGQVASLRKKNTSSSAALKMPPIFTPSPLESIPPTTVREFHTVFDDVDWRNEGCVHKDAVRDALEINTLHLSPVDIEAALAAMEDLSKGIQDTGYIDRLSFTRCMHALSLQQRDLLPRQTYAEFPDSAFSGLQEGLYIRRSIWLALEDPLSSPMARSLSVFIVLVILLSTTSFCVETVPTLHKRYEGVFSAIEIFSVAVFTIELLARMTCTPHFSSFFSSSLNVVDVLAVTPFYLELIVASTSSASLLDASSSSILRATRLVRIFRLLKVGRYLAWLRVFGRTMRTSLGPLGMVLYVSLIAILLFSSSMYYFERGVWDPTMPRPAVEASASSERRMLEVLTEGGLSGAQAMSGTELGAWVNPDTGLLTSFQSIPASFWWCIISMTGVGYGDMAPATAAGKCLACAAFFSGILLSAVPISVISANFHTEYESMKRLQGITDTHAQQPPPSAYPVTFSGPAAVVVGGGVSGSTTRQHDVEEMQNRLGSAWSEPFLRSALQVVRNGRRKLMTDIKAKELVSREYGTTDLTCLVADIKDSSLDKASVFLKAGERGLIS